MSKSNKLINLLQAIYSSLLFEYVLFDYEKRKK